MTRLNPASRIAAIILMGAAMAPAAFAQSATSVGRHAGPYTMEGAGGIEVLGRDPGRNIVGGALLRLTGSGEGAQTETLAVQATQAPQAARAVGHGENISVVTEDAPSGGWFAAANLR